MKKSLSGITFSQNGRRQAKKERKHILVSNSVHTWPGEENSKKNSKKIQKFKKPHSGIIFSQNGTRLTEKKRKKFQSRIPFILNPSKKIPKKMAKKIKKNKKTSFRYYIQPKWDEIGRERVKKILVPNSFHIRPGQENF